MNPLAPPLRLAEAAGVLSLATDLAMGQPLEHGLRTAMLALRLAQAMGLSEDDQVTVYYTGLLHFAGCTAESEIDARFFGDEMAARPPDTPARQRPGTGGKPGMITICKAILSGAKPAQIREQTEGLFPGWLRDLAVNLAGDPALTVSVIIYQDAQELEVLRTGPPHHTEQSIDSDRFTRQHAETLSVAEPPDVQDAVALVRSMLLDDTEP